MGRTIHRVPAPVRPGHDPADPRTPRPLGPPHRDRRPALHRDGRSADRPAGGAGGAVLGRHRRGRRPGQHRGPGRDPAREPVPRRRLHGPARCPDRRRHQQPDRRARHQVRRLGAVRHGLDPAQHRGPEGRRARPGGQGRGRRQARRRQPRARHLGRPAGDPAEAGRERDHRRRQHHHPRLGPADRAGEHPRARTDPDDLRPDLPDPPVAAADHRPHARRGHPAGASPRPDHRGRGHRPAGLRRGHPDRPRHRPGGVHQPAVRHPVGSGRRRLLGHPARLPDRGHPGDPHARRGRDPRRLVRRTDQPRPHRCGAT